jgi:hypothetical protein
MGSGVYSRTSVRPFRAAEASVPTGNRVRCLVPLRRPEGNRSQGQAPSGLIDSGATGGWGVPRAIPPNGHPERSRGISRSASRTVSPRILCAANHADRAGGCPSPPRRKRCLDFARHDRMVAIRAVTCGADRVVGSGRYGGHRAAIDKPPATPAIRSDLRDLRSASAGVHAGRANGCARVDAAEWR